MYIFRALLALAALALAYIGFGEARLKMHCPTPLDLDACAFDAALRNAFKLSERRLAAPPVEMKSLVRDIVEQITVAADRIEIRLSRAKIAKFAET